MPKMDGFQLCRECKNDSLLRDIPFIFYTATYVDGEDRKFGLSLGADEYVVKPMEPDELMEIIGRVVGSKDNRGSATEASSIENESEYLAEHNKRLIRKLESKMLQLEKKQFELENEIEVRKRAEEALSSERAMLQTLLENAPFGMILVDGDGRFTYVNTKFREIFGYDGDDVPDGVEWFRKAYPDDSYRKKAIKAWLEDSKAGGLGEKRPRVFNVICRDGSQKTVNFILLKLASGHHIVTCEDITNFKKLESQLRQSQKMEAIGNLAGGIAHDFNNILTTLMGYAGLLQMEIDKNSSLRLYVDQIVSASQKAANLTRSLLAFSRRQPVVLNPLDINESIRSAERLLKRLLTEDIEFKVTLTPDDVVIMADSTQIDQILFNLLANARDALPGGGSVFIESSLVDIDDSLLNIYGLGKPGKYVQIAVSDTGVGMDGLTKEKIFEPFFTTKEIGKGTGLGLSTVYGIVKQHDGHITVYSEPGNGTTIRMYFPAIKAKEDRKQDTEPAVRGGKETILIAEDNREVRNLVREILKTYGYRVIEAVDGEDAVEKFKDFEKIDMMIVDSVMPKKNGREVYEEIKKIRPAIRVLFTSGHTKDTVLDKGIIELELDFIQKPLTPKKLLLKVREILDRDQERAAETNRQPSLT